ncbi:MAG: CopD family protein [Planctomycetes bacterium]|nr:CopD family protein [Planctomycetota bacterium]
MLWIKSFHLISLFIWVGGLLGLSRMLGYHVKENEETRAALSRIEKRMYYFVTVPGGVLALITGLMLLFGVGREGVTPMETALSYLAPRDAGGHETPWYITFHVKLALVVALLGCDFYLGSQIRMLARGGTPPGKARYSALHGIISVILMAIVILMIAGPLRRG